MEADKEVMLLSGFLQNNKLASDVTMNGEICVCGDKILFL